MILIPDRCRRRAAPLSLMALILAGCVDHVPNPPQSAQIRADAATVVDPREIVALVPTSDAAANLRAGAVAGFPCLCRDVPMHRHVLTRRGATRDNVAVLRRGP